MKSSKKICIVGSGGLAREIAFLIEEINKDKIEWDFIGFIDSNIGANIGKYKVFNNDNWLLSCKEELYVVIAVGTPSLLKKLSTRFSINKNLKFPNLIHPNVIGDWQTIKLGKGNLICSSNTLTVDIVLGNFNIVNLDCTIGHDSVLGSFNVVNPSVNISGGVTILNEVLLGTSATVLQNLKICSNVTIGAMGLVNKHVLEEGVYVGCPIKRIR